MCENKYKLINIFNRIGNTDNLYKYISMPITYLIFEIWINDEKEISKNLFSYNELLEFLKNYFNNEEIIDIIINKYFINGNYTHIINNIFVTTYITNTLINPLPICKCKGDKNE